MQELKNTYPEVDGLKTTPGMRKLTKWEVFILFFHQPKFVLKAKFRFFRNFFNVTH